MRKISLVVPVILLLCSCASGPNEQDDWRSTFDVNKTDLVSTGQNPYFNLTPGYQTLYGGVEDGQKTQLLISVLGETKMVDGVETRVVEERETVDGQVKEVSRNFFAIDKNTNDVYYFGEDVDIYKNGKIDNHGGAWQSGKDGARFGLFMPGRPRVGQKFYQEIAPKVAMDRCEIVAVDANQKVPAGLFEHCVIAQETSPLEPDHQEKKVYGPGPGLLVDGELKLMKYGTEGDWPKRRAIPR